MIGFALVPLLLAAMPLVQPTPAAASLPGAPSSAGGRVYATACATCHGAQGFGGIGPSLRGVGLADVDFYLTTGRMPAAVGALQVGDRDQRSGQRLSDDQIRDVEAYLAPVVAGGPPIPQVTANGDVERGRALFGVHCQQCHGFGGDGGAIGGVNWAPSLHRASINEVADAIRVGPGEMPQFGEHQLDQRELEDVASYVMLLRRDRDVRGVPPFRSTGPVPEGAMGYVAIVALVAFVFVYWRADTPRRKREEAVRRNEGTKT